MLCKYLNENKKGRILRFWLNIYSAMTIKKTLTRTNLSKQILTKTDFNPNDFFFNKKSLVRCRFYDVLTISTVRFGIRSNKIFRNFRCSSRVTSWPHELINLIHQLQVLTSEFLFLYF